MTISQKCQYAIRAIFELAKNFGQGPIKIALIAENQNIPAKFLETILADLKKGGFVISKRGAEGGYILKNSPDKITAWDIIKFIDGPMDMVKCTSDSCADRCPQFQNCAFLEMWQKAQKAVAEVFKAHSFAQLLEKDQNIKAIPGSYCI